MRPPRPGDISEPLCFVDSRPRVPGFCRARVPSQHGVILGSGSVTFDVDGDEPANTTLDICGGLDPSHPDDGVTAERSDDADLAEDFVVHNRRVHARFAF